MSCLTLVYPVKAPGGLDGRVGVGNFRAGQRIQLRPRFAEWVFDDVTAPAPTYADGPFVHVRPNLSGSKGIQRRGNVDGDTYLTSGMGASFLTGNNEWEYVFDARANPSFTLPWDASIDITSDVAGVFLFDLLWGDDTPGADGLRNSSVGLRNDGGNTRLRQTRQFQAGSSRSLTVPLGAYAFEILATAMPTVRLQTETTSKAAFGAVSQVNVVPAGSGIPMSLGNAQVLHLAAPAVTGLVVFHLAWP